MLTEVGEYIVGAYLKLQLKCDFIDYNVRPPGGKLEGLNELDVIGLSFTASTAYLCEVTTHIGGLLYVDNKTTISRIKKKHAFQRKYAQKYLGSFSRHAFSFWSPVVPRGYLTSHLADIKGLDLVIYGEYKSRVEKLRHLASQTKHDTRNPFFRMLQIVEHMRET